MKYTVYKALTLKIQVEASSPQEAWEKQLHMEESEFELMECEYDVHDEHDVDVTDEVEMQ